MGRTTFVVVSQSFPSSFRTTKQPRTYRALNLLYFLSSLVALSLSFSLPPSHSPPLAHSTNILNSISLSLTSMCRYFDAIAILTPLADLAMADEGRIRPRNASVIATAQSFVNGVLFNRSRFPRCGTSSAEGALPLHSDAWTQESSPWSTARECVWPIDRADWRSCSVDKSVTDSLPQWWQVSFTIFFMLLLYD